MTTPSGPSGTSSREYLQYLQAQGMTLRQISDRVGRSERFLRYVAKGERPGANLTTSLAELAGTGQVRHPPPRRTTKAGVAAKVRGPRGRAVRPELAPSQRPRQSAQHYVNQLRQRGMSVNDIAARLGRSPSYISAISNGRTEGSQVAAPLMRLARSTPRRPSKSTDQPRQPTQRPLAGPSGLEVSSEVNDKTGREFHRIRGPRTQMFNRIKAGRVIGDVLRRVGNSRKRFNGTVWVQVKGERDPRAVRIGGHGGYDASDSATAVAAMGGDGFGWVESQIQGRYPEIGTDPGRGTWNVIGIDMDIW